MSWIIERTRVMWGDFTPLGKRTIAIPIITVIWVMVLVSVVPYMAVRKAHGALIKKYPVLGKKVPFQSLFFVDG